MAGILLSLFCLSLCPIYRERHVLCVGNGLYEHVPYKV